MPILLFRSFPVLIKQTEAFIQTVFKLDFNQPNKKN